MIQGLLLPALMIHHHSSVLPVILHMCSDVVSTGFGIVDTFGEFVVSCLIIKEVCGSSQRVTFLCCRS